MSAALAPRMRALGAVLGGPGRSARRAHGVGYHAGQPRGDPGVGVPGLPRSHPSRTGVCATAPRPPERARSCGKAPRRSSAPRLDDSDRGARDSATARAAWRDCRSLLRRTIGAPGDRRDHRHQRQDHLCLVAGAGARAAAGGAPPTSAPSGSECPVRCERSRIPRPMRSRCIAQLAHLREAGADSVAMEVSSHRTGSGPLRGAAPAHGGVHQPDARSPGLSRRHAGLWGGQGPAVRVAGAARAGDQRR